MTRSCKASLLEACYQKPCMVRAMMHMIALFLSKWVWALTTRESPNCSEQPFFCVGFIHPFSFLWSVHKPFAFVLGTSPLALMPRQGAIHGWIDARPKVHAPLEAAIAFVLPGCTPTLQLHEQVNGFPRLVPGDLTMQQVVLDYMPTRSKLIQKFDLTRSSIETMLVFREPGMVEVA